MKFKKYFILNLTESQAWHCITVRCKMFNPNTFYLPVMPAQISGRCILPKSRFTFIKSVNIQNSLLRLSIIILTKLTALAVHYAITILLPRPRNKRELQVYYGLVVCTHRVAQWFKLFSKEAFLCSWSYTIHIVFALSLHDC